MLTKTLDGLLSPSNLVSTIRISWETRSMSWLRLLNDSIISRDLMKLMRAKGFEFCFSLTVTSNRSNRREESVQTSLKVG